jgi:hypothetical protein
MVDVGDDGDVSQIVANNIQGYYLFSVCGVGKNQESEMRNEE